LQPLAGCIEFNPPATGRKIGAVQLHPPLPEIHQPLTEDHQAKMRAAQRGNGGPPRPQQIRAIMLGRLDKMNVMKYMTQTGTHRDGGPFGISLESLAAQGVSLETGALCDVIPKP